MTVLNTVLGTLTGPRRLRSALRQKTVAINSLLVALDGPAELRVQIPAAVFGGDIFGVMSSQLREALIVSQSAPAPQLYRERRRLNVSPASPVFKNSENPFPVISEWLNSSTHWASSNHQLTKTSRSPSETPSDHRSASSFSPLETQISGKAIGTSLFGETSGMSVKPAVNPVTSSTTRPSPLTPALESSLNRYWQSIRETRDASHSHPQPLTESPVHAATVPATESEQRVTPRAWPNFVGRDVSEKLRSFTNATNPLQKPARLSSQPDRQIQNVFNIEVNHANQHASNLDDLGDRIAQILHEQALQHGIDVT